MTWLHEFLLAMHQRKYFGPSRKPCVCKQGLSGKKSEGGAECMALALAEDDVICLVYARSAEDSFISTSRSSFLSWILLFLVPLSSFLELFHVCSSAAPFLGHYSLRAYFSVILISFSRILQEAVPIKSSLSFIRRLSNSASHYKSFR